ncbi:protein bunched, class 2/F/G isoform isoform X2 [Chironomus tepperi]|uniref:protein bunched, class 2/F/G isoform isoform X2 n=1 Tax=Chironomus tepperi TaxID=113505 RepID=UPI00391F2B3F
MASRQNYPTMLNSQTSSNSTANTKEKSSHSKSETSKLKHDKSSSSSSSSGHIPLSSNTIINNMSKRKGTSFQITSVSVSSANSHHHSQQVQRNSTDNNNDYETPSISETFSGEDVFFAQQNAFGTAPVIPTSSQYGLAIVGPDLGGNGTSDVHVSVSDAGINIMGPISSKQDPDHKNERFKVVKIESTEPFKRGRWMCMDYLDHTTLQDDGIDGKDGDDHKNEHHEAIVGPRVLIMNNGEIEHIISDNEELDHEVNKINSKQQLLYNHQDVTQNSHQNTSHPQTMTSIPTYIDHSSNTTNIVHNQTNQTTQSMPQRQLEQILVQEKQLTLHLSQDNNNMTSNSTEYAGMATNGPHSELLPQSSNNENFVSNNNINSNNTSQQQSIGNQQHFIEHHQHAQTMTQEMIHSMVHPQDQQNHLQGLTLPTNILMQNISHDHHHQQQQQSQMNSPNSSNALPLSSIPTQNININVTENASLNNADNEFSNNNSSNINSNNQDNMTNQFQVSQVVTGDRIQQQQQQCESDNQQQTGNLVTNEINLSNNSDNNNNITVSNDGTQQNASSPSSFAGLGTVVEGAAGIDISESASNSVNSGNNNSNATVGGIDDGQAISEDNESKTAPSMNTQKTKEKKCIGCTPGGLATTALTMNLSTISPLCTNVGCIGASCSKDANASSRVSRSASPALGNTSDNPSASGTSAVAIDNKIEQAMDLVKSHLMFAVREEVEVLKEKINELMDRINQLEVENTILKANASQETLSQLTTAVPSPPQQQQQQSASPVVSQNTPSQPQQIITPSQPQATQPTGNTQNQAAS